MNEPPTSVSASIAPVVSSSVNEPPTSVSASVAPVVSLGVSKPPTTLSANVAHVVSQVVYSSMNASPISHVSEGSNSLLEDEEEEEFFDTSTTYEEEETELEIADISQKKEHAYTNINLDKADSTTVKIPEIECLTNNEQKSAGISNSSNSCIQGVVVKNLIQFHECAIDIKQIPLTLYEIKFQAMHTEFLPKDHFTAERLLEFILSDNVDNNKILSHCVILSVTTDNDKS